MFSKFKQNAGSYTQGRYYWKKLKYKTERVKRNPIWADFYSSVFSKKGLIVLVGLSAVLLFHSQIIDLYDKYVVDLLLAQFKEGFFSGVIIFIAWILAITFLVKNAWEKHKFSWEFTAIVLAIGGVYAYYRFINTTRYDFFGTSYLKYLDLIFLFIGVFGYLFYENDLRHLSNLYFRKKKRLNQLKQSFFTDIPLGAYKREKDLFGWRRKAVELVNKIECTIAEQSFAIGVSSEWGAGKTSFFNLVKEEVLLINHNKEFIVVDFNPWFSKDARKIVDDFFNALQESLGRHDSALSNKIIDYSSKLQSISSDVFSKIINTGIGLYYSDPDVAKKYGEINASIKKLNKKIIIFVDDLDRLDNEEVVEVLRIIRNTSNFYNCFFIIAYDRYYINNAVSKINDYNPGRYLDKIIQFELFLPIYDEKLLNEVFYDKLYSKLEPTETTIQLLNGLPVNSYRYTIESSQPTSIWEENLNFDIVNYLKNIRDVHRFLNLFVFDYSSTRKSVDFRDMFLLTLLKFKYPQVWLILSNKVNRKILLSIKGGVLSLKEANTIKPFLKIFVSQISKSVNESLLDTLLSVDEISTSNQTEEEEEDPFQLALKQLSNELLNESEKLYLLLNALFYENREKENAYFSIIFDSNHALYYYPGASLSSKNSLSEFFQELRNETIGEGDFVTAIVERVKSNDDVNEVLGFIHQFHLSYGSLSQFRKLIFTHCEVLFWKTKWPAEELLEIVKRINGATGPEITINDRKQLFNDLIDNYNADFDKSCFISFFLQQILYEYSRKEINDNLGDEPFTFLVKKEVQSLVLEVFNKWSEVHPIPSFTSGKRNLYNLFYSCVDKIEEGTRRVRLLEGAFPPFREAILSRPLDYLATLIRPKYYPETFEPTYLFEGYVFHIWNNYKGKKGLKGFESFLKDVGKENQDNLEFKGVLYFYAGVVAKNGNNLSDLDLDTSLYFENYQSWLEAPDVVPINAMFESRYHEERKKVLDRIIGDSTK